ncbi:MAG: TRAP transporter substrate-binding protein [candidate division NC10 bacterium]|nr:TRAP transporter substrate-binding protein [candidate division NC10 bacterium]
MARSCNGRIMRVAAMAVALACAPTLAEAAKVTLKLGHIRADTSPTHKAALKFADLVAQKTGGEIEIRVFPNSQLGGILDMFTGMKAGSLEMVYGGINTYGFIKGGEVFQITAVPFLYRDYDHMHRVLLSPIFRLHLEAAEKTTGVKVININGDTAPRELTTRDKPVRTAADFQGLKIRIAESAMVRAAMQKLGANPQVIPFADLYVALKQGVVDAQENGVIPIKNMSFFEVQKYLTLTHYIRDVETFYVSADKWKTLSPAQQKAVFDASEEAGDLETQLTKQELEQATKFLSAKLTVIEPDLASIRKALEGVYEEQFEGKLWPKGLLQQVRDFR